MPARGSAAARGHLAGSARVPGRVDLRKAANFAGDREQVVRSVNRLLGGVDLVEHGADQGRLPDVLRNADPLRIGRAGTPCIPGRRNESS
jgi:hypothetical protein